MRSQRFRLLLSLALVECPSEGSSRNEASKTSSRSIGSAGGSSGEVGAKSKSDDTSWRDERVEDGGIEAFLAW